MVSIINKLIEAEGVVFGSPTYNDSVSSLTKVFLDRLMSCWSRKDKLKKKRAAVVAVGTMGGESVRLSAGYIRKVCEIYNLPVLGSVAGKAEKPGEIKKDKNVFS